MVGRFDDFVSGATSCASAKGACDDSATEKRAQAQAHCAVARILDFCTSRIAPSVARRAATLPAPQISHSSLTVSRALRLHCPPAPQRLFRKKFVILSKS